MGTVFIDPAVRREAKRRDEAEQMRLKAIKLFEAATEPHSEGGEDHKWRECRRCLAIEELNTKTGHALMVVALKALRRGVR